MSEQPVERVEQQEACVERVELMRSVYYERAWWSVKPVTILLQLLVGFCAWTGILLDPSLCVRCDREMPTFGHSCGNCGRPPPAGGVIGHRR